MIQYTRFLLLERKLDRNGFEFRYPKRGIREQDAMSSVEKSGRYWKVKMLKGQQCGFEITKRPEMVMKMGRNRVRDGGS